MGRVALIIAYSGLKFHGFQSQPEFWLQTVEDRLLSALAAAGLIGNRKEAHWSRSARTDKGVSAAANCVAFDTNLHLCSGDAGEHQDAGKPSVCSLINDHLPEQLRVLAVIALPGSPHFHAKNCTLARRYEYFLPLWALDHKVALPRNARLPGTAQPQNPISASAMQPTGAPHRRANKEERALQDAHSSQLHAEADTARAAVQGLNEALAAFVGQYSFHSFACAKEVANGASCQRTILECRAADELETLPCRSAAPHCDSPCLPFVRITITGQSFMMHQIRKMIGLALAVARGTVASSFISTALEPSNHCSVPTAPALGLIMDAALYSEGALRPECLINMHSSEAPLTREVDKGNGTQLCPSCCSSTNQWPWCVPTQAFKAQHILPPISMSSPLEIYDFIKSLPSHDYSVRPSASSAAQQESRGCLQTMTDTSAYTVGKQGKYG